MTVVDPVAAARRLIEDRACRRAFFGKAADGFGEPAWDMLLELFVRSRGGAAAVPQAALEAAAGAPEREGVFVRFLADHRMISINEDGDVELAAKGTAAMCGYLRRDVE